MPPENNLENHCRRASPRGSGSTSTAAPPAFFARREELDATPFLPRAHPVEKYVEGFAGAILAHPQQPFGPVVYLVGQRQNLPRPTQTSSTPTALIPLKSRWRSPYLTSYLTDPYTSAHETQKRAATSC